MVYTRRGLSLARIILVNCKGETVLDIIVKPESPVMDYNTRFSGLTKNLVDATIYDFKQVEFIILLNLLNLLYQNCCNND